MKHFLAALLAAGCVTAHAQERPGTPHDSGNAGPFSDEHVQEKQLEQAEIGVRVQTNLKVSNDRKEAQYAENRGRCQAALRIAEACGKAARTFSCDEKGFKPIPAVAVAKHAGMRSGDQYKQERCALDAARRDP